MTSRKREAIHRWLAWNVFFPLHERIKRHPTFEILKEMEAADGLTAPELEQIRAQKLRDLLDYCSIHVPFVKRQMEALGISPSDIRDPANLSRLPLMRKADVRQHRMELRSDIAGALESIATGGSSGEPLICDLSKRRVASRIACRQRVSRWWGVSVGDPEFALWGSPIELNHQDRLRALRDGFLATTLLPAFEMDEKTIGRYLDLIEKRGARQIFGYPSALYVLCRHAQNRRNFLRQAGVKVVFVTGEVLLPHQRELISETFQCPVADGYGGRDSGFIAHECPQGGMHIMSDAIILEVVDREGQPVAPGQAGEIVVTDLYSREFPFLRYATGDRGVLSAARCRCGRPLPLIERIEGRANDAIVTPDGRIMNSLALIYAVREVEGIERFRIFQEELDRFRIEIVRNRAFKHQDEQQIRSSWTKLMRTPVRITFDYLTSLPVERSGKFRHVVSAIPAGQTQGGPPGNASEPASTRNGRCSARKPH
jgi:phenylacetate-CoA ligase